MNSIDTVFPSTQCINLRNARNYCIQLKAYAGRASNELASTLL
ncbi:hypothetical protein M3J09_009195 [Ascochyta lentis]